MTRTVRVNTDTKSKTGETLRFSGKIAITTTDNLESGKHSHQKWSPKPSIVKGKDYVTLKFAERTMVFAYLSEEATFPDRTAAMLYKGVIDAAFGKAIKKAPLRVKSHKTGGGSLSRKATIKRMNMRATGNSIQHFYKNLEMIKVSTRLAVSEFISKPSNNDHLVSENLISIVLPVSGEKEMNKEGLNIFTEVNSGIDEGKVTVMFTPSEYLDKPESIWKLRNIIGAETFVSMLEESYGHIDETFVSKAIKNSKAKFYIDKVNKMIFDVYNKKWVEQKRGLLEEITLAEILKFKTLDDIIQVIEKTKLSY